MILPVPPVEPPPSAYRFDPLAASPGEDLVAVGGDLQPGTLLAAYRAGLFPMGVGSRGGPPMGWWSPDPRGVLPLGGLRVSRSLRRSVRRFEIRLDAAFDQVVAACAEPGRPGRWITGEVAQAYGRLHRLGWAHSVECWREGRWITPEIAQAYGDLHRLGWAHSVECWRKGRLAGGLYGLAVGGLFAGESMFHRETDASKVALVALVELLARDGDSRRLLDVQWRTEHLASLGVVDVPRVEYLRRLRIALRCDLPAFTTI